MFNVINKYYNIYYENIQPLVSDLETKYRHFFVDTWLLLSRHI